MPKHSPGPWFFDLTDGTIWFNDADPITLFEQVDGDDMGDPEKLTADGRLAAASPELLAAALIGVNACDILADESKAAGNIDAEKIWRRKEKICRAAIAKAEGRE